MRPQLDYVSRYDLQMMTIVGRCICIVVRPSVERTARLEIDWVD